MLWQERSKCLPWKKVYSLPELLFNQQTWGVFYWLQFDCTEIRDETLRPIVVPFIHHHHHHHHTNVSHWACFARSGSTYCQYPDHNQQPDHLDAKEMCCTARRNDGHTKYLLVPLPVPEGICDQRMHIWSPQFSPWYIYFSSLSLWHTCVMIDNIILFNPYLDMPRLSGVWIIFAKENCSGIWTTMCSESERCTSFGCTKKS